MQGSPRADGTVQNTELPPELYSDLSEVRPIVLALILFSSLWFHFKANILAIKKNNNKLQLQTPVTFGKEGTL